MDDDSVMNNPKYCNFCGDLDCPIPVHYGTTTFSYQIADKEFHRKLSLLEQEKQIRSMPIKVTKANP